jgi:UDP-N-acetylglucosamine--N-acetylmuramyl-(pentapeptide) pyrophosphoryl-undecaprenol N-acetylglucosamine transferase
LTELAITHTPAILIPYPYAAEDHQAFNAASFADAGAALVFRQAELTPELLESKVLNLLQTPQILQQMAEKAASLAVTDSAQRLAAMLRQLVE